MQVGTCGTACVAAESDGFAGLYVLVGRYEEFRQVTVNGLKVIGVAHDDIVAIAAALEVGDAYTAVESGVDGIADVYLEVYSLVHAAEAAPITVGRRDISRYGHGEFRYVNISRLRYINTGIAVDMLTFPAFGVDVEFGFFLFAEQSFEVFCRIVNLCGGVALVGKQVAVLLVMLSRQLIVLCGGGQRSCEQTAKA